MQITRAFLIECKNCLRIYEPIDLGRHRGLLGRCIIVRETKADADNSYPATIKQKLSSFQAWFKTLTGYQVSAGRRSSIAFHSFRLRFLAALLLMIRSHLPSLNVLK